MQFKDSEKRIYFSGGSNGKEFSGHTNMKLLWRSKNLLAYPEEISVARVVNF